MLGRINSDSIQLKTASKEAVIQYTLGVNLFLEDKKKESVPYFQKAADQGHAGAQFHLGFCFEMGMGIEKDEKAAVIWYRKSAAQGNAKAQCNLGFCFENGKGVEKDERAAADWYTKSAHQGYAEAQFILGVCFEDGIGVEKDEKAAADWYKKSAAQGNANAQCYIGVCFAKGIGVEEDKKVAADWYKKSAVQGHSEAQHNLGIYFEKGIGVEKNEKVAADWYKKSAAQGNARAQCSLGCCFEKGTGVEKDERVAADWYKKSAAQGDANAQNNLGTCFEKGTGVEKDERVAADWYKKSAGQGNANAQNNLAICFQNGRGVKKDEQAAVEWYLTAAEQGYAGAQYNLGMCLLQGIGYPANEEKGMEWLTKAAEQGNITAQRIKEGLIAFNPKRLAVSESKDHVPTVSQNGPYCGCAAFAAAANRLNILAYPLYATEYEKKSLGETQDINDVVLTQLNTFHKTGGAIYDVTLFKRLAEQYHLPGEDIILNPNCTEVEYVSILKRELDKNHTLVVACEVKLYMPSCNKGYFTHWAMVYGYEYRPEKGLQLKVTHQGVHCLWSPHELYESNKNLPLENPKSTYYIDKGRNIDFTEETRDKNNLNLIRYDDAKDLSLFRFGLFSMPSKQTPASVNLESVTSICLPV